MNPTQAEAMEALAVLDKLPGYQTAKDTIRAYLQGSGEPVGYTGSGSLSALSKGADGYIWPTPADAHPIPIYAAPPSGAPVAWRVKPLDDSPWRYFDGSDPRISSTGNWRSQPLYAHPQPVTVSDGVTIDPEEFVRSATRNKSREITTEELVQWAYERGRLSVLAEQSEKRNGKPVPCVEHEFMPYFVENGKTI